jgi:hypothetical protein
MDMQPAEPVGTGTQRPAVGAYALDPKAAYEVMRAWRAYSRDLEQSCSGASSLPHKVATSIIALMFALGFVGWFATLSTSIWR